MAQGNAYQPLNISLKNVGGSGGPTTQTRDPELSISQHQPHHNKTMKYNIPSMSAQRP